jgi:hypothetical protein
VVEIPAAYAAANSIALVDASGALLWWNEGLLEPVEAGGGAGAAGGGDGGAAGGGRLRYTVPGVFKRSDQITAALTLMERRHPLALETEAALFQSMQLPVEEVGLHVEWAEYPRAPPPGGAVDAADAAGRHGGGAAGGPAAALGGAGLRAARAAARLRNRRSGAFPAFVHYNGPAKAPWTQHSFTVDRVLPALWYRRAVAAAVAAAADEEASEKAAQSSGSGAAKAGGRAESAEWAETRERFWGAMRRGVVFVRRSMAVDVGVDVRRLCAPHLAY